jgi:DNA-directed RNA polymerase subunit omega|tara:strand:- start:969 stop:1592 length:624 start_codon:yes stop_codon:yes gene_type:complete
MARITVEDCKEKVENQYELILLARERAMQLGRGEKSTLSVENDKRTVLALREIAEGTVGVDEMRTSIVNNFRRYPNDMMQEEDLDVSEGDAFSSLYKGEEKEENLKKVSGYKLKIDKVRKFNTEKIKASESKVESVANIEANEQESENGADSSSPEDVLVETIKEESELSENTDEILTVDQASELEKADSDKNLEDPDSSNPTENNS